MPLRDLHVVAFEQAVAAPFCTRQLADLGARVIKVERPGGETARGYDAMLAGESSYFAWLNRGKESIVLDLKSDDGRRVALRLAERADVLVHNLAPGAMERLGLGYDEIASRNAGLIHAGISGYGRSGPMQKRTAYDLLVQAESGVMSVTGSGAEPAKVGVSIADISAGMYAFSSILTALYARARTGRGAHIEISMFECLTEWMTPALYAWIGTGMAVPRSGMRHPTIVPYGAYPCADGDVVFAVQNEREWARFCTTVLRDRDLASDSRCANNASRTINRAWLEEHIERTFALMTRSEVDELLLAAAIPSARLNDVPAVIDHPQLDARGRWTRVRTPHGEIPALIPPHNIEGVEARMGDVPALGAHTAKILSELGMSE